MRLLRTVHPRRYLVALAAVLGAVLLRAALDGWLAERATYSALYGAVAIAVWYGGLNAGVLAALIGFPLSTYLFRWPSYGIDREQDIIALVLYVLSCTVIIGLGERAHRAKRRLVIARQRAQRSVEQLRCAEAEMREAGRRFEALQQQLRESDRRKDEFLATLAHELRNPLAPLRNGLEIMRLGADADTVERMRAIMERQLAQMTHLLDDLLDVSRINAGRLPLRRQALDIRSIVERALETSRPALDAGRHACTIDAPVSARYVDGDPVRLVQVFSNLLNNAAKFTRTPGQIRVLIDDGVDGEVCIRVRDTGVGISADQIGRVFQMFSQVDAGPASGKDGLGIGLALVRGIVELHGGRVEAASDGAGLGSVFAVHLPLTAAPLPVHAGATSATAAPAAPLRVLVADDNADSAASMALMLRLAGHETAIAHDGLEAVAIVRSFRPQVAILDIGMPELDGYGAARQIRALPDGAVTRLVAVTGWGQPEDRRRSREAGFDAHLVKPVDPRELASALQAPAA